MTFDRLVFRVHAIQRMALRDISEAEVRAVLTSFRWVDGDAADVEIVDYH